MRDWWSKKSRVRVQLRLDEFPDCFPDLAQPQRSPFPLSVDQPEQDQCPETAKSPESPSEDSMEMRFRENREKSEGMVNDSSR